MLFVSLIGISTAKAEDPSPPTSVARRVIICDTWQYSSDARLWGCLTVPRQVLIAGGKDTDQTLQTLQDQIKALEERIKKLEHSNLNP